MSERRRAQSAAASERRQPLVPSQARPEPSRRLRRLERRESILAAAARAFARAGFEATSMEEIAAEAGVTKLILYRHFDGKRELYEAVLTRISERLAEVARTFEPRPRTRMSLGALLTVARENPDGFLLLFRYAAHEPQFAAYAKQVMADFSARAEEWLGEAVSDPVLRRWAARLLPRTGIEAIISWLEVGDPSRDEEFLRRLQRTLGVMVRPLREPA